MTSKAGRNARPFAGDGAAGHCDALVAALGERLAKVPLAIRRRETCGWAAPQASASVKR